MNASDTSVLILEGAQLYGNVQNLPGNSPRMLSVTARWMAWCGRHQRLVEAAEAVQNEAFEQALRL